MTDVYILSDTIAGGRYVPATRYEALDSAGKEIEKYEESGNWVFAFGYPVTR